MKEEAPVIWREKMCCRGLFISEVKKKFRKAGERYGKYF